MNATTAIKTYARVGVESGATTADPHKLISMLYQGALLAIATAKNSILCNDVSGKGAAISKAIAIIDEGLNASLNKNAGGELAQNLSALYGYMSVRLITANLKNDIAGMDEVAHLLAGLKEAWENIRPNAAQAMPQPEQAGGEFRGTAKPAPDAQMVYGRV